MATPDHMKGINALPSTRAYNDALAAAKSGGPRTVEEARAVSKQLEALRMDAMRERNEKFPLKGSPFGKAGTLAKSINATAQKEVNARVANAAPKHARLRANVDSTCFESLTWKDGVATAAFYRGGQIVYDYADVSRDDFIDWVSFGSLGQYFNENIR